MHMDTLIRSVQNQLPKKRGISRLFTAIQLFFLFTLSALQRAIALLFQSPQKSFTIFHTQDGRGMWDGSFHQHRLLKRKVRLFSWSSVTILVVASVVSFAATQLFFPGTPENAAAATSTFTVSNANNSGAGSLRQAITDCNNLTLGNDCIVQLDNAGATQTVTLASSLPNLSKPAVFTNLGTDTDLIIDGSGLGSGSCWSLANGSAGTVIEGVAFTDCPDTGITIASAVTGVQIGNTASAADLVYFSGGTKGVFVGGDNVTIQHAVFGSLPSGTVNAFSENAIFVSSTADGFSVTDSVIAHAGGTGLSLDSASSATVSNNTISNNTDQGIEVQSVATATVSGNTIQSNGSCGVRIIDGSSQVYTGNTIASNTSNGVCVSGSPSGVRIGATSAATVGTNGNSITGAGSVAAISMGTATPSGFNIAYNSILSQASSGSVVTYTSGSAPFAETTSLAATTTAITGTAGVSSGVVAAYQNGSFIGATTLSSASFEISGAALTGSLIEGATIRVVVLNASNNPSAMTTSATVENPPVGIEMNVTTTTTSTTARFVGSSGATTVRTKVYVATSETGLLTDTPDIGAYGTSHDVTVSGLSPATQYYWKVTTDAQDGSFSNFEVDSGTFTTATATDTPSNNTTPDTASITVDPSDNTAVFSFTTTAALTPKVYVSRTQPDVLSATPTVGTSGTTHSITVTGLTAGTLYYYSVTGSAADSSFTDAALGSGSFTTDATNLDDDFLSENATVNDQVVYDAEKKLYLGPDEVNLELENTTKESDVSFEVKEKDTDTVVLSTDWQAITKQVITKTFENLEQGVEYIVKGTLRKTDDPTKQDSAKTISTFEKTDRKAPAFATYSGNVTVTAVPTVKMGGDLKGLAGEVILQDIVTGKTAASCDIPKGDSLCTLEPYPAPGDYRIQFRSLKGKVPSAPDQTLFTIAKPTPTSALFVDRGNANFMNRIVLNDSVKVVGNAVKSSDVEIYLNGTKVKNIEHKNDKTTAWSYNLSLKGKAKKSYILRVIYRDRASDKFVKTFTMPFVYSSSVANLVLQNLRDTYSPGAVPNIRILGGRGDVVSVYVDGAFVNNLELEQVDGSPIGKADIALPTATVGSHTLELSARNSVGLKGATVKKTYTVVRPQPVTVAAVEPKTETTTTDESVKPDDTAVVIDEPTKEPSENTNTNTSENPVSNTNTGSNVNTVVDNINTGTEIPDVVTNPEIQSPVPIEELPAVAQSLLRDDIATAGLISIDPSVTDIANVPKEYLEPVTDPVKKAAVATALKKTFENKADVQFVAVTTTDAGSQVTAPSAVETGAVPVFTQQKNVGLPGFGKQSATENYGIQLGGTALPYSLVKVTVRSTPIVKMTRADENGKWTMTVPADTLDAGKHTASVQVESQGVVSDSVEIANFVIVEDQKLSNTTWVVIVNVFIAALILILVLGIQLGRKNKVTTTRRAMTSGQVSSSTQNPPDLGGGALGV